MWSEAVAMITRAERLHRQFFHPTAGAAATCWEPPIDILESDRWLWIVVALPGVEASNLEVTIEAGVLVVAGARRFPTELSGGTIHRLEIPHGRFERRIRLPAVPLRMHRTKLENGCLVLSLLKQP